MSIPKKNVPNTKVIQKKAEPAKNPPGAQLAKGKVLDKESTRLKGLEKMKSKMAKSTPAKTQRSKNISKKSPSKGR